MKKIKVKANVVRPKSVTVLDLPEMPEQKFPKLSKRDLRKLLKDPRIRKYIDPVLQREKSQRKTRFRQWWWNKGFVIINTILSLVAAIAGIIALLR